MTGPALGGMGLAHTAICRTGLADQALGGRGLAVTELGRTDLADTAFTEPMFTLDTFVCYPRNGSAYGGCPAMTHATIFLMRDVQP